MWGRWHRERDALDCREGVRNRDLACVRLAWDLPVWGKIIMVDQIYFVN